MASEEGDEAAAESYWLQRAALVQPSLLLEHFLFRQAVFDDVMDILLHFDMQVIPECNAPLRMIALHKMDKYE